MYKIVTLQESVRVPPSLFGEKMAQAALTMLREQYARTVVKNLGIVVLLQNAKILSKGKIIPGDGAAYFDVQVDALVFVPEVNEIVLGEVSEIIEFGAFVRLGPIDGLVHVSQVMNDYMTFDKKNLLLISKQGKKTLKKADTVKAKVATVSLKETIPASKISLTMRPDGLGKQGK